VHDDLRNILAIGFVTPAFMAAGALLVSIPIIIHLLNRRRYRTVEWAAMEFLLRALRKNRRRIRFEQWLLLAVRCAVLLLLGLALARPMGCEDTTLASLAARRAGLHVFVIDNSYSMAYEADRPDAKTNLDQAKLIAKRLIDRLHAGGESIAIVTAARPATAIIATPAYDLEAARSAIDRIEQSYSDTDIPGALQLALKIGQDESRQPNKYLYLLTDATRSAWDVPAQAQAMQAAGRELAGMYRIMHFNLSRPSQWNAAVVEVKPASNLLRRGYANDLTATVHGYGATREGLLQWRLDDQVLSGSQNVQPQPDSAPITQGNLQIQRGGLHVVSVTFTGDDRLKLDDTRNRVVDVASELKVLLVEGERGMGALAGSGAFLMQALAPGADEPAANGSQGKRSSYLAPELVSDLELGNKVLSDYRAVILAGVGNITPHQADQLKRFVESGGTLMMFMGEPVNGDNYNATLLPRGLLPGPLVKRVSATGNQEPFSFDFKPNGNVHELLNKFKNMPATGLDKVSIFTYWQIEPRDPRAKVVLQYVPHDKQQADPAVIVQDSGAGHVLVISTSAYVDWSTLPAKLNFAPLVHELLSGTMSSGDSWMNLNVGDELRTPPGLQVSAAPVLKDPQQAEVILEQASTPEGQSFYRSRPLRLPGVYTLITGTTKLPIAVNVPSNEADIRPMDDAAIRKVLGEIDIDFQADQVPPPAQHADSANDFGWSVMIIVLGLVGTECFLAMRFGHYKRTT
jgi:Mg-chelatase subunit ChlD